MRKIYAICTTLEAGHPCDQEKIKESGIKVGDKIELAHASVGAFHTDVWLIGYNNGCFNSVFFDYVDENGEKYNIYYDEYFRTYW